ncbi:UbiA prenyltransferase family-domain-containing protein [Geopyxis carbonaria]|nr:UbiA prenyltransferase family-domain-containing protein [Geopyxis carbonaria]
MADSRGWACQVSTCFVPLLQLQPQLLPLRTHPAQPLLHTTPRARRNATAARTPPAKHYFLSNFSLVNERGVLTHSTNPAFSAHAHSANPANPPAATTPLRRRRKQPAPAADAHASDGTALPSTLPPDASSLLSTTAASASPLRRQALAYLALSKPRLTALIVLTTMASYAVFPVDPLLASPAAPSLSALTLTYLTLGTALSSASANALNMAYEPAFDAQMSRTRNRPLALAFAAATGTAGVAALYGGCNPTVAALGALNIALYAGVYTPLKRVSVANTWVGAVVGGIPPLMGWAAASGATALGGTPSEVLAHPGGWLLAALLFAWQFPHFNALSYNIRHEYRAAGYQMTAWKYPAMHARVALRYSLAFFPICVGLWMSGVTDAGFVGTSSVVNAWLTVEAWRFWRHGGEGGRARKLFWASVWHLPILLALVMVHKAGLWRGVGERIWGVEGEGREVEI